MVEGKVFSGWVRVNELTGRMERGEAKDLGEASGAAVRAGVARGAGLSFGPGTPPQLCLPGAPLGPADLVAPLVLTEQHLAEGLRRVRDRKGDWGLGSPLEDSAQRVAQTEEELKVSVASATHRDSAGRGGRQWRSQTLEQVTLELS